ncbi:hypothetical protein M9H77_03383 [Catharanthus roseus]|uniref:Uncharacterized protein n=1 Tax=Catharanthus roseus TaxID=4058 RepID=A0ACC0CB93_CATRO|nr:hypothetical protein M9H77_03383 [Catharanthus roseus]
MYFPMFAPAVRPGTQACKPYIQQYPMLGYKNEHKPLDIRLRLDMMTDAGDSGLLGIQVAVYSRTPYPISGGTQADKQQDVRGEELICGGTTSVPDIPPSSCTEEYMDWFLPRSHPRIQNPSNIPRRFHVPVDPPILAKALLDLVACEASREDVGKEERLDRVLDLLRRHRRTP